MDSPTRRTLLIVLLAAFIAVGARVDIPIGPVPISLQSFVVLVAGFVLGSVNGTIAVGLYWLAGLVGLPVFADGAAGLGTLTGPTGGYLLGFLPSAALAGAAVRTRTSLRWRDGIIWGLAATLVVFVLGLPWLKHALGLTWRETVDVGMLPFLPGAALKLAAAVAVARVVRRLRPAQGD